MEEAGVSGGEVGSERDVGQSDGGSGHYEGGDMSSAFKRDLEMIERRIGRALLVWSALCGVAGQSWQETCV